MYKMLNESNVRHIMAGEIEDPMSFQVEYLPTGSISFGRFETESLSWERRSSFSHNRYLEEVEKCSKPGSVTEKKAYFEAHFRRKALLRQASSDSQNGVGLRAPETDGHNNMNCINDYEDHHLDENHHSTDFDVTPIGSENYINEYEEHCHDEHYYFDMQNGWDEGNRSDPEAREIEVTECKKQEEEAGETSYEVASQFDNTNFIELEIHQTEPKETQGLEFGMDTRQLIKEDNRTEAEQKSSCESNFTGEVVELVDMLKERLDSVKVSSQSSEKKPALKAKNTNDQKVSKPKIQSPSPMPATQRQQSNPPKSSPRTTPRASRSFAGETPVRKKTEGSSIISSAKAKQYPNVLESAKKNSTPEIHKVRQHQAKISPRLSSLSKNSKPEEHEAGKSKTSRDNRRDKDAKEKKVTRSRQSPHGNGEIEGHSSARRPRRTAVKPELPDCNASSTSFSFKSHERAEKRKEFYMKLEEKLHAKEAEMNQIQARTQVETEAEIKQLRRRLNFKATPMPSFYNETTVRSPDIKKVPASQAKSPMPGRKPMNSTASQETPHVSASPKTPRSAKANASQQHSHGSKAATLKADRVLSKSGAGKGEAMKRSIIAGRSGYGHAVSVAS
ncbi:hypothetical protein AMTRI_Chr13g84880 [Amborella trichopoda]